MGFCARLGFWLKDAAMRRGTPALMPAAMAHAKLSRGEIDALAWDRLAEVVRFAAANVPHHQRLGSGHHRDGGCIPSMALDKPINAIPNAYVWQAHVFRPGQPDALVRYDVETAPENLAPLRAEIAAWLDDRFNHEYRVEVRAVERIQPSRSGKYVQIVMED